MLNPPTFQDVLRYLATTNFTEEQQSQLVSAWNGNIRSRRADRKAAAARKLFPGMDVTFKLRGGGTGRGKIQKVGRTNCWVIGFGGERYYAPATGLTPVTAA